MLVAGGSGILVGHSGSMPGFLAGCYVDRDRGTGAMVLANATTGLRTADLCSELLDVLEESEPTVGPAWRPEAGVPVEYAELLGTWHWGRTPMVFSHDDGTLVVRVHGEVEHTFTVMDGRVIGVSGYHAGEPVVVVRDDNGSVDHLELSTFVLTREPR
jgi:D-alanyl-D-alanine carboxypeptidase